MKEIQGLEDVTFDSSTTYTILEEIGRGGMGIVYLAQRTCMGVSDLVVLKTIRVFNPKEEEHLRNEANIATQLRHENIVKTYGLEALPYSALPEDVREDDSPAQRLRRRMAGGEKDRRKLSSVSLSGAQEEKKLLLIVMDYVCGIDLHRMIREHIKAGYLVPIPLGALIITRVCRALAYAHAHIIHRDISPDNVLINHQGVCKLTDFGIAVAAKSRLQDIAGKTIYMAPEVYLKSKADERSDLFSLGCVFYYTLTGIPPLWTDPRKRFEEQLKEVHSQLEEGIPSPHEVRSDIPEELSQIVMKMMHPEPDKRYSRARVACDDLEQNYLYAKGFGPTSASLAAYIRFFESQFREIDTDDVTQLTFLRNQIGRMSVQRPLKLADYSLSGMRLVLRRQGSSLHEKIRQLLKEERQTKERQRVARPMIKVRFGDCLVESFFLDQGQLTVGSDKSNRCVLPDFSAPANQARFFLDAQGVPQVEDLTADPWLRVNGEKVKSASLEEGDRVRLAVCQAFFLQEKTQGEPARVVDVGPTRGAEIYKMEKGGIAFRLANSPAPIAVLGNILEELYLDDVTTTAQLQTLRRAVEAILGAAVTPSGRAEVVASPIRSRIVVQVRDMGSSDRMSRLFGRLKAESIYEAQPSDSELRTLVQGLDRVEYLPDIPAMRIALGS